MENTANKNVVSSLNKEQRQLFTKLRNKKLKDWETISDPDYINLWKGVIEKYPETAHFIYELIQNADDACATEVKIYLYKDKLVFVHNGEKQFSLTDCYCREGGVGDINAITSVANSTKKDDEQTIGKFGVGFKSVFQYTDVPYIYDDTFWFKIENYIVPKLLESDHALRNAGETLFELPFKNSDGAYADILQRLQNLNMPVLFLPNVKKITWHVEEDGSFHEYSKEIIQASQCHGIAYEYCRIHDYNKDRLMYLFHRDCETSEGVYDVGVGYYLNSDGSLDIEAKGQIFCFFPTSEYFESCFVSQAPFLLVDNRDSIKRYEAVNLEFLHRIAELASDALLCLRDIGVSENILITDNIYRILNIKNTKSDLDDRNVYLRLCLINAVRSNKLLLNSDGEYAYINDVYSTTKNLESLFSSAQLRQLCGKDDISFIYLKDYRSDFHDVEQILGVTSFNNSTLAKRLTSSFMAEQSEEWCDRLLTYIEENAAKLWRTIEGRKITENWYGVKQDSWSCLSFLFAPIAKEQSGEWIAPYTLYQEKANVCLPYKGYEDAGENAFGKVLDGALLQKHGQFFRIIGIKEPDMADYMEKTLLKKYEGDNLPDYNILKKDFVYIYNLLKESTDYGIREVLRKKWRVKQRNVKDNPLCKICELNIPTDDFIDFANGDDTFKFVDCDFYCEGTGLSCSDVMYFFEHYLNVKDKPKVIEITLKAEKLFRRKIYDYSYQNFPQYIIDFLDKYDLSVTKFPYFKDFQLEGYNINNCSKEWSHALWRIVCNIGIVNNGTSELCFGLHYKQYMYRENFESSYLHNLKHDKWIKKNDNTFCSPSEISTDEFHQLGYKENSCIERKLEFMDKLQAKKLLEERQRKEKEDSSKREEVLRRLSAKNIPCSAIESILSAIDNGTDVENLLKTAQDAKEVGVNVEATLKEAVSKHRGVESYISDNATNSASACDIGSLPHNDYELPNVITSNITPLLEIANSVGSENLPFVAEHVDDMMNFIMDEKVPNMVRRIINYIGKKIYEQYLVNEGIKFEAVGDGVSGCDYIINNGEKYVTVVSTKKSIADNNIPVGISAVQNAFLRNHPNAQIRIVRISFMDISILAQYERIVSIYGKEDEPAFNNRLRKECDELAINYWKGVDIGEFDAVSPEYSIRVERKNKLE